MHTTLHMKVTDAEQSAVKLNTEPADTVFHNWRPLQPMIIHRNGTNCLRLQLFLMLMLANTVYDNTKSSEIFKNGFSGA
jgi:hypothetical protein